MSQLGMGHVTHMNESCHTRIMSHMGMSHVAHGNGSCHTHEWVCVL